MVAYLTYDGVPTYDFPMCVHRVRAHSYVHVRPHTRLHHVWLFSFGYV